ncbi:MAG TPA: PQQ-dependent sugar dehydrogenase [Opitutaceae bacterium]|nr:PQQ-dependent sugar dehydrogenase [Opitutaceae bacterium]
MRTLHRWTCLFLAAGCLPLAAGEPAAAVLRDAGVLYNELCANCHDGGKASSFQGGSLKHGTDNAAISRAIREGFPGTGMPAFGATLSEAEIHALVVLVRERVANFTMPVANLAIDPREVRTSDLHDYRIETVVEPGLQVPWSFVFLPDGRILLTERAGRLRVIERGRLVEQPVRGVPEVIERGEGGLMAVAIHPDFARNKWVYLAYSDPGPDDTAMTRIVRGRLRGMRLADIEPVFSVPREEYQPGHVSFGCRMEFAGGYLFFSIGDRGVVGDAQRLEVPNGKIHRVTPDGKIPNDNPHAHTPGAVGSIWCIGVRNPQGLAIDPRDGSLWESEHGPRGGDELNRIEPGRNYGWPVVTHGINYDGTPVSETTQADGMEPPARYWTPSIAVSPITFYSGEKFPRWKNSLFLGSLAQQKFIRFEIDGPRLVREEELFTGLGRVRDIKTGPDGFLYVALEQIGAASGRLVRLVPADEPARAPE